MDEEVDGGWVGDGKEEDGVVWRAGHEARETVRGDVGGGGAWWVGGVHEIKGESAAEEAAEVARVGCKVVDMELLRR